MQNKDAGYVENQQQNIADAIDLLPRLATGIDVNIKFRRLKLIFFSFCNCCYYYHSIGIMILTKDGACRIDDFEFTPECAIFDLLDIPLYHGWIVDPQVCFELTISLF